ncbi:MAG: CDP-glycerol glycerophosphotransferase family protein [Peribacillus sp.]
MSIYLSNYWTLYKEFVDTFHSLEYRGIPIVLLTNFYQQIDPELRSQMESESFLVNLKTQKLDQALIQPYFEKWLEKLRAPINEQKEGKVLINPDYTRIPERTYINMFDPKQTIILSRSNATQIYGIPNECIRIYEDKNNEASNELIKEAKAIFDQFNWHPAFGNAIFQKSFINRIPQIVTRINMVSNLFDKKNISSIIVGTTEDIQSRALSIVGLTKGIKSICLQHGILMGEEAFMPVFTTVVGVYGEYEKSWYSNRGVSNHRIAELGHPKFDEIYHQTPVDKATFIKKYELDPNKRTLLVITGPQLDFVKFEILIKSIMEKQNYQIIIKPHPWEIGKKKLGVYLKLEEEYESLKVYTARDNNLYDLISQVDGVVSSLSTVVLESILFNKPVFVFNFLNSNRVYDYFDMLGNYIQSNPNRLTEVINNHYISRLHENVYSHIRNRFLSMSYNDGRSSEKLANLINSYDPYSGKTH